MKLIFSEDSLKRINILAEIDNTNVNVMKGILGNLIVKKAEKYKIAAIYGALIRKEKIPIGGGVNTYPNSF